MEADFGNQLTGRGRDIHDERVLAAMSAVPRDAFVPEEMRRYAYADGPLGIGEGQTISQPFIVALMTQSLGLRGDEKILEIGTGSGYQAAVLAEMGCEVYSVERIERLSRKAGDVLSELGYSRVHLRVADGSEGWAQEAPFDAVIVTCAADEFPQALYSQLRLGGRLIIPVGPDGGVQTLWLYERSGEGAPDGRRICDVRFVPLLTGVRHAD